MGAAPLEPYLIQSANSQPQLVNLLRLAGERIRERQLEALAAENDVVVPLAQLCAVRAANHAEVASVAAHDPMTLDVLAS